MSAPPHDPSLHHGLDQEQVEDRSRRGLTNEVAVRSSRSLGSILAANLFTVFNLVMGICLVVILAVGQLQDTFFAGIVFTNIFIGVAQEYRAKRTLDRLAILNAPRVRLLRSGRVEEHPSEAVVQDDLMLLGRGDQIPADAIVVETQGFEVDESLLTGESHPVPKAAGREVLSGSFVVAGHALCRATRVGEDSHVSRLTAQAKKYQLANSELRDSINRIGLYITWALIPVTALIVNGQMMALGGWEAALGNGAWRQAVVSSVASIVGMVPEGLVFLTSLTFLAAAVKLSARKVLVQELPAVETLARVDMMCFDKTGTLTSGTIVHHGVVPAGAELSGPARQALAAFANDPDANATALALREAFPEQPTEEGELEPFSAERRSAHWKAATGSWLLGAPEVVLPATGAAAAHDDGLATTAADLAEQGFRVLALSRDGAPEALVTFREHLRADAAETVRYFQDQDVKLRIFSGDNPRTVAAVAREAGFSDPRAVDAASLPEDAERLATLLDGGELDGVEVFGRVTPDQKRHLVAALRQRGHVVGMTGDGVNDIPAMKEADISIAMETGSPATKAVSKLVLMDGKFSRLPSIVAEGRRVIANVERVSNLFLTKTCYAIVMAIVIGLTLVPYPFLPRHLSIVNMLTIGIPSFFLAVLPNKRRYVPGFLRRVLWFAVPCGTVVGTMVLAVYYFGLRLEGQGPGNRIETQTGATLTLLLSMLGVLILLSRPWNLSRGILVATMASGMAFCLLFPPARAFFALEFPEGELWLATLAGTAVSWVALASLYAWLTRRGLLMERQ